MRIAFVNEPRIRVKC